MGLESLFVINQVSKSYKVDNTSFDAVSNVSLTLPSKGLICITGKSGSGKSTFLNLLARIEKPSRGEILYLGKDIGRFSDKEFSNYHLNEISIVFQHYNLFEDLSAIENVSLPLFLRGEKKNKAYEKSLELFKEFHLDSLANQKVKYLSGGEKQRVAILRSLVTNPKAILCDEPTGALDHNNGLAIMEIFKEISKSKLILMVSHNYEHVKKYSDRIIFFKDGKIVSDTIVNNLESEKKRLNKEHKYSSKWTNLFLKLNLKRNIKKSILSLISCSIGFASIFLAFGFSNGADKSQKNALNNNLAVSYATASVTTYFELENSPLSFKKEVRPDTNVIDLYIDDFDYVVSKPNLSYLFSPYPVGRFNGEEISGFEMVPLLENSVNSFGKHLLVSGELNLSSLEDVIVNEEFVKLVNSKNESIVDDIFKVSYSTSVSYQTNNIDNPLIRDSYSYNLSLRIVGVVKEFSFLNTPKVYYSYDSVYDELNNSFPDNISSFLRKPISYIELIESAKEDDVITSYSSLLFLENISEKDRFFELVKKLQNEEDEFQITSNAYEIQQSYATFINSFSDALFVFVIIAFIGINLIVGMISLSSFIQNKKESAILTCLGARTKSIISIYLSENYLLSFISIIIAIIVALISQSFINELIYSRFSLANLIDIPFISYLNIPFGLIVLIFIVVILCVSLFTLTPLLIYRHISLADELRDE